MAFFIGVAIAAQAAPGVIALATCIVCFAAIGTMAFVARNRMGFFINGYRQGRTRKVAIALLAIVETIYVISLWLKIMQHIGWAPIVAGAVIVPIVFFASYRWQNAYRSEFGAVDDIRP